MRIAVREIGLGQLFRHGGRIWVRIVTREQGNAWEVVRFVCGKGREYGGFEMLDPELEVEVQGAEADAVTEARWLEIIGVAGRRFSGTGAKRRGESGRRVVLVGGRR